MNIVSLFSFESLVLNIDQVYFLFLGEETAVAALFIQHDGLGITSVSSDTGKDTQFTSVLIQIYT